MNPFPQLWARLCLEDEFYTCPAFSPTVSEVLLLDGCLIGQGTNISQKIYLFSARHIVKVDGKRGLFRGLPPRIVSSAISTVVRSKVKQVSRKLSVQKSFHRFII